jgi:hypothetical protein
VRGRARACAGEELAEHTNAHGGTQSLRQSGPFDTPDWRVLKVLWPPVCGKDDASPEEECAT